MRKLRLVGLSALAVLAVSAIGASAAQAAEGTIVSAGSVPYVAKQVGQKTLTLPGGRTLSCEVVESEGVVNNGDKDVTATPKFEKCHATAPSLTFPATIETTDCTITYTDFTTTGVTDTYSADTDLCQTGGPIHIKLYSSAANHTAGLRLCEYTIAKQGPLAGVTFVDTTTGTLTIKATEVAVALTRSFGTTPNCGEVNTVSKLNGTTSMAPNNGTLGMDD